MTVLADILARSVKKFGPQYVVPGVASLLSAADELGRNAVGWRDVLRMVPEVKEVRKMVGGKEVVEKKEWLYYELSDYKYWTYTEFGEGEWASWGDAGWS